VRQDWTLEHSSRLLTKAGWEWKRVGASYDYLRWERRNVAGPTGPVARYDTIRGATEPRGHELSGYVAERFRPVQQLTVEVGARVDRQTRTDDRSWSPRFNVAWQPKRGLAVRAAWGRYVQSQELFQLAIPDGDTTFYAAERAIQRVLGVEHTLAGGASVRLELYERTVATPRPRYWNLENDVELFPERVFARRRVAPERVEARGAELFARGRAGPKVIWSAGYTLARVRDLVAGVWVADPVDQKHSWYVDVGVQPTPAWRVAAAWQYHTGWPITRQTAVVTPLGQQRFRVDRQFGPLNAERLPGYRRVDVRVTRDFRIGRGQLSIFADVFNALGHDNVRGYNWGVNVLDQTGRFQMIRYPIDLLPRLPSLGASFQF
jgi:outer membrane receptor protein involved in Fe transport